MVQTTNCYALVILVGPESISTINCIQQLVHAFVACNSSSSIPARGDIFLTVNGVPLHTVFYYQPPSS